MRVWAFLAWLMLVAALPAMAQSGHVNENKSWLPAMMTVDELIKQKDSMKLIDIRSKGAFTEYHIPGSINVPAETVMSQDWLARESTPLVLVDKDGYEAMAVGTLVQQTGIRSVAVLTGGIAQYWKDAAFGNTGGPRTIQKAVTTPVQPALDSNPAKKPEE